MASEAPPTKRIIMELELTEDKYLLIQEAIEKLKKDKAFTLLVLQLINCNGATSSDPGYQFSSAFCDVETLKDHYAFGTLFKTGMDALSQCVQNKEINFPEDHERLAIILNKLLSFILDEKSMNLMINLRSKSGIFSESQIPGVIAEHIMRQLIYRDTYLIDNLFKKTKSKKCPCGCNTELPYGDTSIGNTSVWHGHIDIMVGHGEDKIPVTLDKSNPDSPNQGSPVVDIEVKLSESNAAQVIKDQVISQTIVYSFLQSKQYPHLHNSLFPSICVCPKEIQFSFYDADNDVFLQSLHIPFYTANVPCFATVIALWLVLNYKYLSSGLTDELKDVNKKFGFFSFASSKLRVYKEELSSGNIGIRPYSSPDVYFVSDATFHKCS